MPIPVSLGERLLHTVRNVSSLRVLPDHHLSALADALVGWELAAGEVLVHQGARGAAFGVVVEGRLEVSFSDRAGVVHSLPDLGPGGTVSEVAVLSDTPALATLRAIVPTLVAVLLPDALSRFSERHHDGMHALVEALRPEVHRHATRFVLRQNEKLRDLDPQLLADLESELEPVTLRGGGVLMRAGERDDTVYIVVSGRLRVVADMHEQTERVLSELGPGETIGEMSLITGEARSADVYAIRDTQLARLSKPAIERLLRRHPSATLLMLARGPVARVRAMNSGRPPVASVATVAILPASPAVDLDAFAERLTSGLARLGTAVRVTSAGVDAALGRTGAAQTADHAHDAQLAEWMAEQELEHRFVVYQADRSDSPWSHWTIRQADHIVLVADASADPRPGTVETTLLAAGGGRTGRSLVLLYQAGESPSGTVRWLEPRSLDRHLHVRASDDGDHARVARMLTGHAIGLTLGGGFARGLAHIGVLRALRESGIPIDAIGGSSMGAMIGAQHLLGWDEQRMLNETARGLERSFDDFTIPFLAFKKGGKFSRLLQQFFGGVQIEDLWLPYFCTSANLNRVSLKVHGTGSLATAVLATTRAPGVFPPIVIDGELHVDGGLVNNVPVDVMARTANHGPVIGIDVSPPHPLHRVSDYGDDISGWQAIWNRFNPKPEKRAYRPSILLILMRLIEFGGIAYRVRVAEQADLYISPDVLRFRRNDFQRASEIVEAGHTATRAAIAEWQASIPTRADAGRFRGIPLGVPADQGS
jgi:predicted acylesterase/phospholipase RssA/CRP-like cAMP-binding protein